MQDMKRPLDDDDIPTALPTPRVDAVGIVHYPEGWEPSAAPPPRRRRLIATLVLFVFVTVGVVTTIVSATRYCLTTDGADTSALTRKAGE